MGCEDSHLLELHPLCGIVICQSDTKVYLKSIVFSKLTVTVRRMAEHEQSHSHYVGCAKLAPIGTYAGLDEPLSSSRRREGGLPNSP